MPVESSDPKDHRQSRRSFLAKLGLGVAAAAAATLPLARRNRGDAKTSAGMSQEFPGQDSIFHPAQDPRRDPRRNKLS